MCGIIGILGKEPAAPRLVEALRRLEYRGYDSAGVATLENGVLVRRRAEGKLAALERLLAAQPLSGTCGIGHTRWATHGKPVERNAHPHATARVAAVHNGIIENFRELREELEQGGAVFESDTDTETVVQLLDRELAGGAAPAGAMRAVLSQLQGAFALAIVFSGRPDMMIGARRGSPLAVGYGNGEMFLGSDAMALAPFTDRVIFLEEGDWVVLSHSGAIIYDETGAQVSRPVVRTSASALLIDKGNHRHFMAKEIHEQPEVVSRTLAHYVRFEDNSIQLPGKALPFDRLSKLTLCACGTAFYAALTAKYWFEHFAKLPVEVDIGSEFRYREAPLPKDGLAVFVSQSGETADTLASLRYCKEHGQSIAAVVNVPESSIAREADSVLPTLAGPEIGVASTKAFTCQLTVLASMAIAAGRKRGVLTQAEEQELVRSLIQLPRLMTDVLRREAEFHALGHALSKAPLVLYLGRGPAYPLALEGALKLKEISYLHAEGFAAGELKHGPIALIDESVPVIAMAPKNILYDKMVSNMQEVAARGGQLIVFSDAPEAASSVKAHLHFNLPAAHALAVPILYAIPIQLIAYHTAVEMGTDVDQPRNLAKSVTVE
ncbi:MAG: glutamine--fructose-6-phosphate transaminase (isomerizing) [Rhodomicrobium sp.]